MILTIQCFLFISFGYSLFEKLKDKQGYSLFLAHHLKLEKSAKYFWWLLVILNTIVTLTLLMGMLSPLIPIAFSFKITACTILILLFGQRIANDYQGAANLGIYMALTIIGWYLETC